MVHDILANKIMTYKFLVERCQTKLLKYIIALGKITNFYDFMISFKPFIQEVYEDMNVLQ